MSSIPLQLQTQTQHLLSVKSTDIGSSSIAKDETASAALGQGDKNNIHSPSPSPSEVAAIKRQCAADILSLVPDSIARAFFRGVDHDNTSTKENTRSNQYSNQQAPPRTLSQDNGCIGDNEILLEVIEKDLLDPFSDAYCNKHFIFAVIEMVLVRLIPELSEHSISGLLEERGVVL